MDDNVKEIKMVENIIILLPSVTSLASKSLQVSAQTSTINSIEMVKGLYTTINLTDEVNLPFKVVYNKEGYKIYSDGKEYIPKESIKVTISGKNPTDGSIEITTEGKIIVKNLKFGSLKCNQSSDSKLTCKI